MSLKNQSIIALSAGLLYAAMAAVQLPQPSVSAQLSPALQNGGSLVERLAATAQTAGQLAVPGQFNNAAQFTIPLTDGVVRGWGGASVLQATDQTTLQPIQAVLTTANADTAVATNPLVHDISVMGRTTNDNWGVHGVQVGGGGQLTGTDRYDGVRIHATGADLHDVHIFYIPGIGLRLAHPGNGAPNLLDEISMKRMFRGILVNGPAVLRNIDISTVVEYGIKLENSVAQLSNVHVYGSYVGLWIDEHSRGDGDVFYLEQSPIGLQIDGSGSRISNLYNKDSNSDTAVEINGSGNHIDNFSIGVKDGSDSGFRISGSGTELRNGGITVIGSDTGIRLLGEGANGFRLENAHFYGASNEAGSGITVEGMLNNSVIITDVSSMTIGLDLLYDGQNHLGENNYIWLTGSYHVGQLARLPETWHPSNRIYLNGVLQLPAGVTATEDQHGLQTIAAPTVSTAAVVPVAITDTLPTAAAQPRSLPDSLPLASGTTLVPVGYTPTDQVVISRYADGVHQPAGRVLGWGEDSVLTATAQTAEQSVPAVVKSEDYGEYISQWQIGTYLEPDIIPAVLQPLISDVTITGENNDGGVSENPQTDDIDQPDRYDGLLIQSNGMVAKNIRLYGIPGTAMAFNRPVNPRAGQIFPFDRSKPFAQNISIQRAYRGMHVGGVDHFVENVDIGLVRDYALRLDNSAVHMQNIHTWGGLIGIWGSSGTFWGNDIHTEQSPVGIKIEEPASSTMLTKVYSHDHSEANMVSAGSAVHVDDFVFDVSPDATGLRASNQIVIMTNGRMQLQDNAIGIDLQGWSRNRSKIDRVSMDGTGHSNTTGIIAHEPLQHSTIIADLSNLTTGLDLNYQGSSGLGAYNYIWITGENTDTLVNLPASWHSSNKIFINGELQGPASCGDGFVTGDEQCDTGGIALSSCTLSCEMQAGIPVPVCGNAIIEDDEECDDGNAIETDDCTSTCHLHSYLMRTYSCPLPAGFWDN